MSKIIDKLIDDIIELILEDMDCHHEVDHDEDGVHTSVEYNLNNETKLRGKIKQLLKPGITEEWIYEKAIILTTKMPLWVTYKTRENWAKDFIRSLVEEMPTIGKDWLPTAENINALPEPVRNYIGSLEMNADRPSMVADNIIMKDTIKALEKLTELPEITEAWTEAKAKEIKALIEDAQDEDLSDPVTSLHYLGLCVDITTSIIEELGLKIKKQRDWRGTEILGRDMKKKEEK